MFANDYFKRIIKTNAAILLYQLCKSSWVAKIGGTDNYKTEVSFVNDRTEILHFQFGVNNIIPQCTR